MRDALENPSQARPAQIGHAERPQAALGPALLRKQRDDVRVPQPGQRQVLFLIVGDHLEHDQPVPQRGLGRQVGLAARAAADLRQ